MKSFDQISENMFPKPKKRIQYRRPPTPVPKRVPKNPKCRVAPLIIAMYPEYLELPTPAYTKNTKDLLAKCYEKLVNLKKRLLM